MRWWCSADGTAWTWDWKPYLGSWVVVGLLAAWFWRAGAFRPGIEAKRKVAVVCGLILILASIEWPLSALGAGYLASAQMIRQVLVVLIAVPMLLYGAPESMGRWLTATDRRRAVLRRLTYPLFALLLADGLLFAVNLPVFVDPMVTTQLGSFLIDALWLVAGVIMWLPVQPPAGMAPRLSSAPAIVYLVGVSVAPLPIAFFMTWSDLPLFQVYELAPRVFPELDVSSDQEFAAAIFQVLGGLVIWIQIAARFVSMASRPGSRGPRGRFVPTDPAPDADRRAVSTVTAS